MNLNTGATYHVCPKWFSSFEKLDGGLVSFRNGHTCHIEGIDSVRIKMFDGMVRVAGCEVHFLVEEKSYLSRSFGGAEPERTLGESVLRMFSGSLIVLKGI